MGCNVLYYQRRGVPGGLGGPDGSGDLLGLVRLVGMVKSGRVVQVVQVVRGARMISLDDTHSENIWWSCSRQCDKFQVCCVWSCLVMQLPNYRENI